MRRGRTWIGIAVATILLLTAGARAQQFDSVVGTRGTTTFGNITEISRTQVALTANTGNKQFPVNEIQRVTFKGEPQELRKARDAIRKGQLEDARALLQEISTADITRTEILQDIQFYKAYAEGRLALTGGGDKAAAVRALRAFESDPAHQNSFHYFETMELLGDLAVALSSFDNAVRYYERLSEAPWPDYQLRANLLQADALVAAQKYPEALAKYEAVLAMGLDDAEARERKLVAVMGKAVCLAEAGQPQQGIGSILEIIQENDSREKPQLFARAYNALGTCYLKSDQPHDALLAYLHVDLLFNQSPEAHAEALYHLSQLWHVVNKAERANRARSVLKSRYSGSSWANRE
jgi:tetratricopeptide (TPR) repeat protein